MVLCELSYVKVDKTTEYVIMSMANDFNPNRIAKSLNLSKVTVKNYLRPSNPTWREYHGNMKSNQFKEEIHKSKEELVVKEAVNGMLKKIDIIKSNFLKGCPEELSEKKKRQWKHVYDSCINRGGNNESCAAQATSSVQKETEREGKQILESIRMFQDMKINKTKDLGKEILSLIGSDRNKSNKSLGEDIMKIVDFKKVPDKSEDSGIGGPAKEVSKTACELFQDIWNKIDHALTDKEVVFAKEFRPGWDLKLVPSFKQVEENKLNFRLDGKFDVINKATSGATADKGDIYVAGYASTDRIDRENEKVDMEALEKAFNDWISDKRYANMMIQHSNVQVADPVDSIEHEGKILKTGFDKNGLFLVSKLREYGPKVPEIVRDVRHAVLNGKVDSYSIGGEAMDKKYVCEANGQCANKITDIELWEVTLCKEGQNPDAKFKVITPISTN